MLNGKFKPRLQANLFSLLVLGESNFVCDFIARCICIDSNKLQQTDTLRIILSMYLAVAKLNSC